MEDLVYDEFFEEMEKALKDAGLNEDEISDYFFHNKEALEHARDRGVPPVMLVHFSCLLRDLLEDIRDSSIFVPNNFKKIN